MADWFAFFVTIIEECVSWMGTMQIFGVSLGGFVAGCFLMGVIFRIFYKP